MFAFRPAIAASLAGTCVAFAYAAVETWLHAMPADAGEAFVAIAFAARAATLFATGPALLFALALTAVPRFVPRLRWVPHVVATAGIVAIVALDPTRWWVLALLGALFLAARRVPWLRHPDAHTIRVSLTVAALAAAFACAVRFHWGSPDSDESVRRLIADSLLIFVLLSYFGSVTLRVVVGELSPNLRPIFTALFFTGLVVAAGLLANLYFSLYVVPKLFLVLAAIAAVAILFISAEPREGGVELRRLRLGAGVLIASWVAVAVLTMIVPVTSRFGPYPLESMTGFVAAALSLPDDRDLDGFYAVSAGGNDCAPRTRSTTLEIARCIAPEAEPAATASEVRTFEKPVRHVFVLTVDALRPDEVGAALTETPGRRATPGIERLMARGVTFRRAYAPANSTYIGFRPLLSGTNPLEFLERDAALAESPHHQSLAAATGLFSFRLPERRVVFYQTPLFPDRPAYIGQVADEEVITGLTTDSVVDATSRWLDGWAARGRRESIVMALYTHDPHATYECIDGTTGGRRCYRDEVENVDRGVLRLQELLDRHRLWDESIVVLLSDHGEAFGEHNQHFHASSLFEEQIHVPLVVVHPELPPGTKVDEPVSVMRLVATLADATHSGAAQPSPYRSLLDLSSAATVAPPVAHDFLDYSRPYPMRRSALILGDEKLIYDWGGGASRLFDLSADPGERNDLASLQPQRVLELQRLLAEAIIATARE